MTACSPGYTVRHHYRYEYTAPVSDVHQKLIMVPPDRHGDQVLTAFDLEVRGATGLMASAWHTDPFGNRVYRVEAERVDHAVDFEAWFAVRREDQAATPDRVQWQAYLSFTALTTPDQCIRDAAHRIAEAVESPAERLRLAREWVAQVMDYQPGVTGTQTPAAMALHLGRGVCQDYAHILLSLLRSLRIAARYVSGHLPGDGALHAWVEAFVPDPARGAWSNAAVIGCDPTHGCDAGPDYIVVATGRDFADVTSTSGVFTGGAIGTLHWSKLATRLKECVSATT
jgi:transglutaminase-like putative cysteine protease